MEGWRHTPDGSRERRVSRKRRKEEKRKKEEGGKEEEQNNKVQNIQDTDEQQRCIVSIFSSFNDSFITIPKTFYKIMAFLFVLFRRDRFFNFCCIFRQRFSAAYLFKLFLLLQSVHATLFEIVFHYCTTHPCHKINVFKRPFRGSRRF